MSLMFLILAACLCVARAGPDQGQLNALTDKLLSAYRDYLQNVALYSYPLEELELQIVGEVGGIPTAGNFTASRGNLQDLRTLRRSGDAVLLDMGDFRQLKVNLDFGQLRAIYQQYILKYGWMNYVSVLVAVFNQASASAVIHVYNGPTCNLTIEKASIDTFGQLTTNLDQPPVLKQNANVVALALYRVFIQSFYRLEGILKTALFESSRTVNLCTNLSK